jgi:large subunit ribosomal protein L3
VTVIEVEANRVTQVKSVETDGYNAIQVTTGAKKASRVTKPAGHFAKAGVSRSRSVGFRLNNGETFTVGSELKVDLLADVKMVDVTGTSKGKGFAGTVKRHNFRTQDMTHGNSCPTVYLAPSVKTRPGPCIQGQKDGWSHGC